mgnify:CR=1 FL=1|tara:strand:- start:5611 stop:7059 length:1449 start_codon:yes stop_codon:yes gene_type:complete
MSYKILVVGTGPAGYGLLEAIYNKKNISVTIIDNSQLPNKENELIDYESCVFSNNKFSGNRMGSFHSVIDNESIILKDDYPKISKTFGGFSNVWGGTVDFPSHKLNNYFLDNKINLDDSIKHFDSLLQKVAKGNSSLNNINLIKNLKGLNKFKKKLDKTKYFSSKHSTTAINNNILNLLSDESICKFCNSFNWACQSSTIWDTKESVRNFLELKNFSYIEKTKILSVKEESGLVECTLEKENSQYVEKFNKVFLGGGAISTSIVMLNSDIVNQVEIKSSDLIQIPFLKLFKTGLKNESFTDLFANYEDDSNSFFIQIYFFSKSVLMLSSNIIKFVKFVKFIPNAFLNFFGGIFLYLNEDDSSTLIISKSSDGLSVGTKNLKSENKKNNLKILKKALKSNSIIPLGMIQKEYLYGSSNHLGGQFFHNNLNKYKNSSDREGRVKNLENVHIVDSSVLPYIDAGPLTFTMMCNSYRIGKESLKDI